MPHAHQNKNRRIQVSSVAHVPTSGRRQQDGKLAMVLGVAVSMVVIIGLYAASFRYNTTFQDVGRISQRWSILSQQFSEDVGPLKLQLGQLRGMKQALTSVLEAKVSQAEALKIMKSKIETAATGTTQTKP